MSRWRHTILSEATDPNLLYDGETALRGFGVFDDGDLATFAEAYFDPAQKQDRLHAALAPALYRFGKLETAAQEEFRHQLRQYVNLYAFLSQVLTFVDADLERLYVFARMLLRKLPRGDGKLPYEVQDAIDMASYGVRRTSTGKIKLDRGQMQLGPMSNKASLPAIFEDDR
jgi:hypothetical protein